MSDGIGAFFIIWPIIRWNKANRSDMFNEFGKGYAEGEWEAEQNSIRKKLWMGFGFLVGGFALQIWGNLMQYWEIVI